MKKELRFDLPIGPLHYSNRYVWYVFRDHWLYRLLLGVAESVNFKRQFGLTGCYYIHQAPTQCYPNIADVDIGTQPFEYDPQGIQNGKDKCY